MKSLTCEMCGGTDLLKQDGVFVCQNCGVKYSIEEAKKMMIEGTVEVAGTVKVDNTSFVEKYLQNARRAMQKEDWEETEKYYNLVEQNDPTNIEAIFYSAYGKAKNSLINSDIFKRQATFKVLTNSISIIDDNFDVKKESENRKLVEQMSRDIIKMAKSSYVYTQTSTNYGTYNNRSKTEALFVTLNEEFCRTLENIAKKLRDKKTKIVYYKLAISHLENYIPYADTTHANHYKNVIMTYRKWIRELEPGYTPPLSNNPQINTTPSKSSIDELHIILLCGAILVILFFIGLTLL